MTVFNIKSPNRTTLRNFLENILERLDASESVEFVGYCVIDDGAEYCQHGDDSLRLMGMTQRLRRLQNADWDEGVAAE